MYSQLLMRTGNMKRRGASPAEGTMESLKVATTATTTTTTTKMMMTTNKRMETIMEEEEEERREIPVPAAPVAVAAHPVTVAVKRRVGMRERKLC